MSTFSWITLCFLQLYVMHVSSDRNNSFLSLFQLQSDHCGAVFTCGMEYQSRRALEMNESCCITCSCEDNCTRQGNCCPDFELTSVLGGNKSTSINDYQARLLHFGVEIEHVGTSRRNKNDVYACVEAASLNLSLQSRRRGNYYKMITTCPTDISNTDIDLEQNCTKAYSETLESGDKLHPLTMPVTSLMTHRTYQNIYCLRCSENGIDEENVVIWRIFYTCANDSEDTLPELNLLNMNIVYQQVKSERHCFLTFKPRTQIAAHVTKCNPVDVDTCPMNSSLQLKNICKRYYFPITMFKEEHLVTYTNLACYLCNSEDSPNSVCNMKTSLPEYSLELNMPDDRVTPLNQGETTLQVSFSIGRLNRCFMGHTFDPVLNICKRVLCPRLFYNVRGSCVPTFSYIENTYFTTILQIKLLGDNVIKNFNAYFDIVGQNVRKSAFKLFGQFTYGLWEKNGNHIMVFSFVPSRNDTTYVEILESLSLFLERIAFARQVPNVETMTYISNDNSLVFVEGQLKERGRKPFLFPYWPYKIIKNIKKEVMIKTAHLCYRTKLERSNTYVDKKGNAYMKKTKAMLSPRDIAELQNDDLAVCFDDLYENFENISSTYMFGGISAHVRAKYQQFEQKDRTGSKRSKPSMKGQDSAFDFESGNPAGISGDVSKGLLVLAAFALTVVLIFAVRMMSRTRRGNHFQLDFIQDQKKGKVTDR